MIKTSENEEKKSEENYEQTADHKKNNIQHSVANIIKVATEITIAKIEI